MKTLFRFFRVHRRKTIFIASAWTLMILIACLIPGEDLPEVDVPLIDKWVHFLLFGGFSFLWTCTLKQISFGRGLGIALLTTAFGYGVELLQGSGLTKGRSYDMMDFLADSIGGILGLALFFVLYKAAARTT